MTSKHSAVAVDIQSVYKTFGNHLVLRNISLSIQPKEIFVIMGPSGSGKSVLLKTIIGLEAPSQGQVLIEGKDAAKRSTHTDIITSMVFQSGALFSSMTVYDNLALYPREHELYDAATLQDKVSYILKVLCLEHAAYKLPAELSGGMRKRVAIARSLMMEPQLILFDEPTSELDPVMSANIIEVIATLKEAFDVTTIVVSHDRDLAFSIGDRLAVLFDGAVQELGTPQALKASTDPRISDFFNPIIDPKNPRFKK